MTSGTSSSDACNVAGFSLLEMLVVIAILAFAAAMAMPHLSRPSDGLRLQALVGDLEGALRLTRSAAIAQARDLVLVVDVDKRTFDSPVVALKSYPPDIVMQMTVAEPERLAPSRGGFRFFADSSSTGGDLVLRLSDREAKICVNWLTGRIRQEAAC